MKDRYPPSTLEEEMDGKEDELDYFDEDDD